MNKKVDSQRIGTWTSTQDAMAGLGLANQTVRVISNLSLGGSRFRLRFSNAYGTRDLAVGAAHVGLRQHEAALVTGTNRHLTLGGLSTATIPAGAYLVSDPVALDVPPLSEVAVSLYLPGELPEDFRLTGTTAATS